jgi:hypothetical protein
MKEGGPAHGRLLSRHPSRQGLPAWLCSVAPMKKKRPIRSTRRVREVRAERALGSSGSDLARAASQIWYRTYTTPVVLNRPNRGDRKRVIASPQTGAESAQSGSCGSTPGSSGCRSKCSWSGRAPEFVQALSTLVEREAAAGGDGLVSSRPSERIGAPRVPNTDRDSAFARRRSEFRRLRTSHGRTARTLGRGPWRPAVLWRRPPGARGSGAPAAARDERGHLAPAAAGGALQNVLLDHSVELDRHPLEDVRKLLGGTATAKSSPAPTRPTPRRRSRPPPAPLRRGPTRRCGARPRRPTTGPPPRAGIRRRRPAAAATARPPRARPR